MPGRAIYRRTGKRTLDLVASTLALAVLSPAIAAVAAVVWTELGSPVLFRQLRPGLHGRPFVLIKFRSMREAAGLNGRPRPDVERLTALGRRLRAWSLDELPTLWNVLRGEMSLIGPRPLLMEYLDRYTPRQARRHEVKPGVTGWAQVNGRNALSWEAKFELDVWYVEHWSLWLDVKILAMTIWQVLSRQGIIHPGSATMPEFLGQSPSDGRRHTPA